MSLSTRNNDSTFLRSIIAALSFIGLHNLDGMDDNGMDDNGMDDDNMDDDPTSGGVDVHYDNDYDNDYDNVPEREPTTPVKL